MKSWYRNYEEPVNINQKSTLKIGKAAMKWNSRKSTVKLFIGMHLLGKIKGIRMDLKSIVNGNIGTRYLSNHYLAKISKLSCVGYFRFYDLKLTGRGTICPIGISYGPLLQLIKKASVFTKWLGQITMLTLTLIRRPSRKEICVLLIRAGLETNPGPRNKELMISTYNVRGLGNKQKHRHLFNNLNKRLNESENLVIALQETYIEESYISEILWRGNLIFTPGTGHGRGCITLLGSNWNPITMEQLDDHRGHISIIKDGEVKGLICNLYAPNGFGKEKREFMENIFERIRELEATNDLAWIIILGDFNVDLRQTSKNRTPSEILIVERLRELIKVNGYNDPLSKEMRTPTWTNGTIASQLDRILTKGIVDLPQTQTEWSVTTSDHAMVTIAVEKVRNLPHLARLNTIWLKD